MKACLRVLGRGRKGYAETKVEGKLVTDIKISHRFHQDEKMSGNSQHEALDLGRYGSRQDDRLWKATRREWL